MTIGGIEITAQLFETETADAILASLPFSSTARTWGQEVYFDTPFQAGHETDARDVVRAYRLLLEHGRRGEVYNVGSGVSLRSGRVLELLREMADPRRPIVQLQPGPKHDPIADVSRLVRCTKWRATSPLETTVSDTLTWWCEFLGSSEESKP